MTSIVPPTALPSGPQSPATPSRPAMPSAPTAPSAPAPGAPAPSGEDSAGFDAPDIPAPGGAGRLGQAQLDAAMRGVMAVDPRAAVTVDGTSNAATFLRGAIPVAERGVGRSGPDGVARGFLQEHGQLFGITDEGSQLRLTRTSKDDLGFSQYRYAQQHEGLPVFGKELIVQSRDGLVTAATGHLTPNLEASGDVRATVPATRAIEAALRAVPAAPGAAPDSPAPAARAVGRQELGWYTTDDGTPHLTWQLSVARADDERWQVYVDARNGHVVDQWSTIHSVLDRQTEDAKSSQVRTEGEPPTGDAVLDVAHDNAGAVYDYFQSQFGRDSIDDRGMKLISEVHYGTKYNNAFWNGRQMTYGDGDGVRFTPFANAKDVVAHEMTHGVTERTAGLRYVRQSGALNESWSDVFGNLVEKWSDEQAGRPERDPEWFVGEEIFTPGTDNDGLRNMSRPGHGYEGDPQPGHMRDYKNVSHDNGGVHINSGIPNKAAYEASRLIGTEKLGKIWYRALTTYMTSGSQFQDAADVTAQAARDLYGDTSAEAAAIAQAWQAVGLVSQGQRGRADLAPAAITSAQGPA